MANLAGTSVMKPRAVKSDDRLFESNVGIPENNRRAVIDLLNARLADSIDMQTQAKFAHWNVKGEEFMQLHLLFDSVAEHVEDAVDLIAERVTALGGRANGTARQVAASSNIREYDFNVMHGMEHVRVLVDHLSALANAAREAIRQCATLGDDASADVFTEIVRAADKDIYFLQSHLQSGITTQGA